MVWGRAGQPARADRRDHRRGAGGGDGGVLPAHRIGRALRAVADDHEAALSIGIPLKTIWIVVWSVAGLVAIVAGIMWGAKSGVQFSLSLIALKALPVLILGGFTSVPGAIVGGLIIGVGEKVAEVYWGPLVGGAIENWFAYVLALGLPAGAAAGPVRRANHRAGSERVVIYREAGQFKTRTRATRRFPDRQDRVVRSGAGHRGRRGRSRCRCVASEYWLQAVLIPFLIYSLAALGLNLLTGLRGAALARHRRLHGGRAPTPRSSSPPRSRASTSCSCSCWPGSWPRLVGPRCSASRACASRASTWRWPRWPPSSS